MPSNNTYYYACLMVEFKLPNWSELLEQIINPHDLYIEGEGYDQQFGIEDEPHVTVLFGLHNNVKLKEVRKFLPPIKEIKVKATKIDIFDSNDAYNVLKFDMESKSLKKLNRVIRENFPYTTDFPKYQPHMTIAYLKKGTSRDYTRDLEKSLILKPFRYKYSYPNGEAKYFTNEKHHK